MERVPAADMYIYIYIYIYVYIYTPDEHMRLNMCMHACVLSYKHTLERRRCILTFCEVPRDRRRPFMSTSPKTVQSIQVCMHACIHVYMYVRTVMS
jgi:hypothetical protein